MNLLLLPRSLFRLDASTHGEDCEGCRKTAGDAKIYASVTGSTGATVIDDRTALAEPEHHSATVTRVWP